MIPRIAVLGYRKSGKTTVVKLLCKFLREHGYKVVPVKHIAHSDFTIEKDADKDTAQFLETARISAYIADSGEAGLVLKVSPVNESLDLMCRIATVLGAEVLIFEGFKKLFVSDEHSLKVICVRTFEELKEFSDVEGPYVFCTLSNIEDRRLIRIPEELDTLKRLVLSYVKVRTILQRLPGLDCGKCEAGSCLKMAERIYRGEASLESCRVLSQRDVRLVVNDAEISLNEFVRKLLKNIVKGFLQSLKGVPENVKYVKIEISSV